MNVIMCNHNVSRRSIFQYVLIDKNRETIVSTSLFAYYGSMNPIAARTLVTQCEFRRLILCGGIGVAGFVSTPPQLN